MNNTNTNKSTRSKPAHSTENARNDNNKQDNESDFRLILQSLAKRHGSPTVFNSFVRLSACALAAGAREQEYLEEVRRWERSEIDVFASTLAALIEEMEKHPFTDIIGKYYIESVLSAAERKSRGEFYTPNGIGDLLTQMSLGIIPSDGPISICEPACGSGAMILSIGKICPPDVRRRLRVTAVDINRTACDMTFINTTLWGIPTRVIHGDSLSMKVWNTWSNLHYVTPWLPLYFQARPNGAKQSPEKQS